MTQLSKFLSFSLLITVIFGLNPSADAEIHKLKLSQRVKLADFVIIGKVQTIEAASKKEKDGRKTAMILVEKRIKGQIITKIAFPINYVTKSATKSIDLKVGKKYLFFIKRVNYSYQCVNYKHGAILVVAKDKGYEKTLKETMSLCKEKNCPKCLSNKDVVPLVYGYPSEAMSKAAAAGEVELGGCMVGKAKRHCKKCDKSW
ncbi:MAG: hypothetical protein P1V97_17695 [Planctomycetota bacterium]|nr:hypothetical protein [Planctomycetota bacterium]